MQTITKRIPPIDTDHIAPPFWMAALIVDNMERFANFHLASAKFALEKGRESASALTDARGADDLAEVRNRLTEMGVQYMRAYSKDMYQALFETQAEFSVLLQRTWKSYASALENWAEQSASIAPVGSAFTVQAIRNTVAATSNAVQQVSEATQQVGVLADETMRLAMNESISGNNRQKRAS
jgi:hypothetical protein